MENNILKKPTVFNVRTEKITQSGNNTESGREGKLEQGFK
jgi:hypothetical protein